LAELPGFSGVEFEEVRKGADFGRGDDGGSAGGGFEGDEAEGFEEGGDDEDITGGVEGRCVLHEADGFHSGGKSGVGKVVGVGAAHEEERIGAESQSVEEAFVAFAFLEAAEISDDGAGVGVMFAEEFFTCGGAVGVGGEVERREVVDEDVFLRAGAIEAVEFIAGEGRVVEHPGVGVPASVVKIFRVEDALLLEADSAGAEGFAFLQTFAFVGDAGEEVALKDIGEGGDLGLVCVDDVECAVAQGPFDEVAGGGPLEKEATGRDVEGKPGDVGAEGIVEAFGDDGDFVAGIEGDANVGHGDFADGAVRADSFEDVAEGVAAHTCAS
jgi:hypothetical protein